MLGIKVGTLVVVKQSTSICGVDELGVYYELYEIEVRPGYGFIFESGGHDGFSPDDVDMAYGQGWVFTDFGWLAWQGAAEATRLRDDPEVLVKTTPGLNSSLDSKAS